MIPVEQWRWFGHAGHFICARWCQFHLCTLIADYLVSTVGEYWPDREVREIHAQVHDARWLAENRQRRGDDFDAAYLRRFGFEDIGYERKYETMVFRVTGKVCDAPGCQCGLPSIVPGELDFDGYSTANDATRGHYALCAKAARGEIVEPTDDADADDT